MHISASAVLLFVVTAFAQISEDEPPRGYHRLVGIPAAKRVKEWEDRIHSEETARLYKGENVNVIIYWIWNMEYGFIFPIALPEGREVNQSFLGQWARALGEGLTENSPNDGGRIFKYVTLQIVSEAECTESLKYSPHPGQLCTSGKSRLGTCRGDSGGPLFTYTNRKFLIGITSTGPDDVCGTPEVSVYVRVSYYLKFIAEHAELPRYKFKFIQMGDGQDIENITVVIRDDA